MQCTIIPPTNSFGPQRSVCGFRKITFYEHITPMPSPHSSLFFRTCIMQYSLDHCPTDQICCTDPNADQYRSVPINDRYCAIFRMNARFFIGINLHRALFWVVFALQLFRSTQIRNLLVHLTFVVLISRFFEMGLSLDWILKSHSMSSVPIWWKAVRGPTPICPV